MSPSFANNNGSCDAHVASSTVDTYSSREQKSSMDAVPSLDHKAQPRSSLLNSSSSSPATVPYVPPNRRHKIQEEQQQQRQPQQSSMNRSFNKSNFGRQDFRRNSRYDQSNGGYERSNGNFRGRNDHQHRSQQVGEDGLLPRDPVLEKELFLEHTNAGINFEKYQEIPVEAFGTDVPISCMRFSELSLHPVLRNSIELCGYEIPTPVQQYSLPIILAKRDLMACAQTGSGKTAAFLFPLIGRIIERMDTIGPPMHSSHRSYPTALILAPTRELACQIHKEACKFTYRSQLRPVVLYGGADFSQQCQQLNRGCDILVATPGRLTDMIERGRVSLEQCFFLCLDEADRMLDMGFESQIRDLVECSGMPGVTERQTLMFSATFPTEIQRLATDFLREYIFLKVGRVGSTTHFITQNILSVPEVAKTTELIDAIEKIAGLTLIFVETRRQADRLEAYLFSKGYPSTSIHGDRTQDERDDALVSFRTGRTPILVATDVAARGLDISNVAHVINYDMPRYIDDYVHRIGRTGRAGNAGVATAFFSEKNLNIVRDLIQLLEEAKQIVPDWLSVKANEVARQNRSGGGSNRGNSGGGNGYRKGGGYSNRSRNGPSDYRYENTGDGARFDSHAPTPMGGCASGEFEGGAYPNKPNNSNRSSRWY